MPSFVCPREQLPLLQFVASIENSIQKDGEMGICTIIIVRAKRERPKDDVREGADRRVMRANYYVVEVISV